MNWYKNIINNFEKTSSKAMEFPGNTIEQIEEKKYDIIMECYRLRNYWMKKFDITNRDGAFIALLKVGKIPTKKLDTIKGVDIIATFDFNDMNNPFKIDQSLSWKEINGERKVVLIKKIFINLSTNYVLDEDKFYKGLYHEFAHYFDPKEKHLLTKLKKSIKNKEEIKSQEIIDRIRKEEDKKQSRTYYQYAISDQEFNADSSAIAFTIRRKLSNIIRAEKEGYKEKGYTQKIIEDILNYLRNGTISSNIVSDLLRLNSDHVRMWMNNPTRWKTFKIRVYNELMNIINNYLKGNNQKNTVEDTKREYELV